MKKMWTERQTSCPSLSPALHHKTVDSSTARLEWIRRSETKLIFLPSAESGKCCPAVMIAEARKAKRYLDKEI
jgi:hypothetical protein